MLNKSAQCCSIVLSYRWKVGFDLSVSRKDWWLFRSKQERFYLILDEQCKAYTNIYNEWIYIRFLWWFLVDLLLKINFNFHAPTAQFTINFITKRIKITKLKSFGLNCILNAQDSLNTVAHSQPQTVWIKPILAKDFVYMLFGLWIRIWKRRTLHIK